MEHFYLPADDYQKQIDEIEARMAQLDREEDAALKAKVAERLSHLLNRVHKWEPGPYKNIFYNLMNRRTQSPAQPVSQRLLVLWNQYQVFGVPDIEIPPRKQAERQVMIHIAIPGSSGNLRQTPTPGYAPGLQGYLSPGGQAAAMPAEVTHSQGLPMRMLSQSAMAPAAQGEYQPSAGRGGLARLAPTPLENSPSTSIRSRTSSNLFDVQDME
ncbi:unnamed protein product [Mycena citricolor]|uniref:Uncharacterized protein n=1 Tax=Mycena citricolor TaxID=2018698 RepID=A0AAD2GU74_9AGAR|nr:unnamed protein product [Mycena citricolor]